MPGRKPKPTPTSSEHGFNINDIFKTCNDTSISHKISDLQTENKYLKTALEEAQSMNTIIKNMRLIDHMRVNILNTDMPKEPKPNDIDCWHCTYPFTNIPCYIPLRYEVIDNTQAYEVIGNFCSLNCALAYLVKMHDVQYHYKLSLMKQMYNVDNIKMAPDMTCLQKYGGTLNINDFRNMSCLPSEYTLTTAIDHKVIKK